MTWRQLLHSHFRHRFITHTRSHMLTHTHVTHCLSLSHTHALSLSHSHTHTHALSITHTHTHTPRARSRSSSCSLMEMCFIRCVTYLRRNTRHSQKPALRYTTTHTKPGLTSPAIDNNTLYGSKLYIIFHDKTIRYEDHVPSRYSYRKYIKT